MVLEQAVISVVPGREADFEQAFATAKTVIAASPGCLALRLSRGIESPSTYVLHVEWERLEDHTEVFRGSEAFTQWRGQVGPFFASPPDVQHLSQVDPAPSP